MDVKGILFVLVGQLNSHCRQTVKLKNFTDVRPGNFAVLVVECNPVNVLK